MKNSITMLYLGASNTCSRAKNFVFDEVRRIMKDERGMELLQVLLIILFVVVIAAALWAFLGGWITQILQDIFTTSEQIDPVGGLPEYSPNPG